MKDERWDIETPEKIKAIKILIYKEQDTGGYALVEYLKSISDLIFSTHASEMRYGESYYYRGIGKNIKVTIVPTITLFILPRKYRKPKWFYVLIYCHIDDHRFDDFPGYTIVPANQYTI